MIQSLASFVEKEARNLIKGISEENFKLTMGNLVKVDTKICLYLFFLINSQYLDYSEIQQVVDQECLEDYYDSFFSQIV